MKKLLFVIIAITAFSNAIKAQEIPFKIQKSEVFKDEYKYSTILMVESDGNGGKFIVRSYQGGAFSSGSGYYFEHYDANLKLIKEYDYSLNYSDAIKQSSVLGVIKNNNQISLIDFVYNKDQAAYICSANTANISDFKFKPKELFRLNSELIKQFSFFSSSQFDGDSGASMILNEDKTAFAVTVDIKDKNSESHKIYLFDNTLNKKIDHTLIQVDSAVFQINNAGILLNQNLEALKHNWLLRGYFEKLEKEKLKAKDQKLKKN